MYDMMLNYPMGGDIENAMKDVAAKTFCRDLEEQLEILEKMYGLKMEFIFTMTEAEELLKNEKYFSDEIKDGVRQMHAWKPRKYQSLFSETMP